MLGQKVRVKSAGWARYEVAHPPILNKDRDRIVMAAPLHPPFDDKVLLDFPLFWFYEDEVERV